MKERLKNHLLRVGPRRFVVAAILSLFITDLLNCHYLKLYWQSKNVSLVMVHQTIARSGEVLENFSPDTISEMTGFVSNAFHFFLLVVLVNNLFFYLFYLRKKLWAQGFILFYTITGAVLQLTFLFDNSSTGWGWTAYNILTVPYYLYVFLGVKLLRAETTSVAPAVGKMAQ